ncbi:cell adhesion molecule 2-like [Branchiostoma lanceolatum]|uniref:cell adhesion molecule 2-like n=1 Tax=Branchiostoma lanceolatum TaxID=7740 RepID=UPI00345437AC
MAVKSLTLTLKLLYLEYAVTVAWHVTRPIPVLEHDHVTLNCAVEGQTWDEQQVDWYYNSLSHIYRYETQERQIGYGRWETRARADAPFQLTIHNISVIDDGYYSCDVGYPSRDVRTIRSAVNVAVPATGLKILPANTTFMEGTVANVSCVSLGGKPTPSMHWIINETSTEMLTQEHETQLKIQINISAMYNQKRLVCEAEQDHPLLRGHLMRQEITLNILYGPHVTVEVKEGRNLTITCTVDANPPPSYVRLTKGKTLKREDTNIGKMLNGEQDDVNIVEYTKIDVDRSDAGTYQFITANSVNRTIIFIPLEYHCDSSGECGLVRQGKVIPTTEPAGNGDGKNMTWIIPLSILVPAAILFSITLYVVWKKFGRKKSGYRPHHDSDSSESTALSATPEC